MNVKAVRIAIAFSACFWLSLALIMVHGCSTVQQNAVNAAVRRGGVP